MLGQASVYEFGVVGKIIYYYQCPRMSHFLILKNQRNLSSRNAVKQQEYQEPPLAPRKPVKARPLVIKLPGEGKWSKKEQTAYILFLENHLETMKKSKLRKEKKIFIKMSKNVRTRVPEQCRSHHQKMMELHRTLDEIIRFFRKEVFPLDQEEIHEEKQVKTQAKQEEQVSPIVPIIGLYRMQMRGNLIRLQINSDKIASYSL